MQFIGNKSETVGGQHILDFLTISACVATSDGVLPPNLVQDPDYAFSLDVATPGARPWDLEADCAQAPMAIVFTEAFARKFKSAIDPKLHWSATASCLMRPYTAVLWSCSDAGTGR